MKSFSEDLDSSILDININNLQKKTLIKLMESLSDVLDLSILDININILQKNLNKTFGIFQ